MVDVFTPDLSGNGKGVVDLDTLTNLGPVINASQFGMKPDASAANNSAKLKQAIDYAKTQASLHENAAARASTVYIPSSKGGLHDLDSTIELDTHGIILTGDPGTFLRWNKTNTSGIRVQGYGTTGATGFGNPLLNGAQGTVLQNLRLIGPNPTTVPTVHKEAHGIHLRGTAIIKNVTVDGFEGDGVYGYSNSQDINGGINGALLECVSAFNCRNGANLGGPDTNGVTVLGCTFNNNRLIGFRDESLLGITMVGGIVGYNGGRGVHFTRCTFGGRSYAVRPDQEAWCSTNAPTGTTAHNQGWLYIGEGSDEAQGGRPWITGLTWYVGGSIVMTPLYRLNSPSLYLGVYQEGGQGAGYLSDVAQMIGGNQHRMYDHNGVLHHSTVTSSGDKGFTIGGLASILGSLIVKGLVRVEGNSLNFGSNPESPTGSIVAASDNLYFYGRTGGKLLVGDGQSLENWFTADTNGINLPTGSDVRVNNVKVLGARQAAIANHGSDATVNAILTAMRNHGFIEP